MAASGRQRLTAAARREQILAVATEQFLADGYRGASMNEIARAAGVTKPLIYLHYESKDGLYAACQRSLAEPLIDRVRDAMAASEPSVAMPLAVAGAIFAALEDDRRAWTLVTDRSLPRSGPVARATSDCRGRLIELAARGTTEVLGAGGPTDAADVEIATRIWISACDTLVGWWLEHPAETAAGMAGRVRRLVDALARVGPTHDPA